MMIWSKCQYDICKKKCRGPIAGTGYINTASAILLGICRHQRGKGGEKVDTYHTQHLIVIVFWDRGARENPCFLFTNQSYPIIQYNKMWQKQDLIRSSIGGIDKIQSLNKRVFFSKEKGIFNQLDACCSRAYQGSTISKDSIAAHLLHKLLETWTILPRATSPPGSLVFIFCNKSLSITSPLLNTGIAQ